MRLRAANTACAVAEHFRDRGKHVMLMLDSVTRHAHAQRQVGLAAGEPPATRGYTPSVFANLSVLLERAGAVRAEDRNATHGSITGFYTVLVEGDDMTEPVADAARGILDGHIILDRKIAQSGRFPAIDVLDSVSRVANDITTEQQQTAKITITKLLAEYRDVEELIRIGAYAPGSSPATDTAVEYHDRIESVLRQPASLVADPDDAVKQLIATAAAADADSQRRAANKPGHNKPATNNRAPQRAAR
jgi:flagellum-specific ATP synthase